MGSPLGTIYYARPFKGAIHGGRTHGVLDRGLCTWGVGTIHEADVSVGFYGIFHQPNE